MAVGSGFTLQLPYLWYLLACWLVAQSSGLESRTRTGYQVNSGNLSAAAQHVASWLPDGRLKQFIRPHGVIPRQSPTSALTFTCCT